LAPHRPEFAGAVRVGCVNSVACAETEDLQAGPTLRTPEGRDRKSTRTHAGCGGAEGASGLGVTRPESRSARDGHARDAEGDHYKRCRAPPVLPESAQAVAAFTPGPEDAKEH
jgi:hypothetical protein